jgi:hypothetical protein
MGAAGLLVAWWAYGRGAVAEGAIARAPLYRTVKAKFYVDEAYLWVTHRVLFRLVAAGRLPRARTPESAQTHTGSLVGSALWRMTLLAVAFAMVFNVVVGGLWSFAAEYAGAGAAPAQVARVMAWATAAGLAGAASAFLIGSSRPRRHMLVLGYSGILLGAGLLQFARGPAGFAAGCGVLSLAWNFCVPYVFAAVAGQDPTGKLMPAANLAFALGLALGPLLAGAVIETSGIDALFPCALAALALGTVLTLRITRDSST